jgi:UDP-N-acetylmuramyl tripeptide synthase
MSFLRTTTQRTRRSPVRLVLVRRLSLLAGQVSRVTGSGGGSTLPGRVARALMPDVLAVLAAQHRVVLVSGTNGKTTTTLLLANALGGRGPVISNGDGANLTSGLISTLLANGKKSVLAVLEVDEVALIPVLGQVRTEALVLLNLSRDQLDRTSEVRDHLRAWTAAIAGAPGTVVVANADDALVTAAVLGGRPDGHDVVWVWAGKPFREDAAVCPRCNAVWDRDRVDWRCLCCGLSRPDSVWQVDDVGGVIVNGEVLPPLKLGLPGRANVSNALMAAAAAQRLGVDPREALRRMSSVSDVGGRYARASVGGRDLRLLLAKNPAGWLEALEQIEECHRPVVLSINARDADGNDPSWLWDVPFEQLRGRPVVATGERARDLAVRLRYAGVTHHVATDVRAAVDLLPLGACDLVANYSAFVAARRDLFAAS